MAQISFPTSIPSYCAASLTLSCPPRSMAIHRNIPSRPRRSRTIVAPSRRAKTTCAPRSRVTASASSIWRKPVFELTKAREIVLRSGHFRFAD